MGEAEEAAAVTVVKHRERERERELTERGIKRTEHCWESPDFWMESFHCLVEQFQLKEM